MANGNRSHASPESSPPAEGGTRFTGIVVCHNEAHHLPECLATLSFCEQVIVVDLESTDESVRTAQRLGAEVLSRPRVPVVEQVYESVVQVARNDWIVLLDPDERMPSGIEHALHARIREDPNLALIGLRWQFYFKGRPLYCTVWGLPQHKAIVRHRARVEFFPDVHRGWAVRPGFNHTAVSDSDGQHVQHIWMRSYRELLVKHLRYVSVEGEAKYRAGERFRWPTLIRSTSSALKTNLFRYGGIRGGWRGIFLSVFYSWYVCTSLLSLKRYENRLRHVE